MAEIGIAGSIVTIVDVCCKLASLANTYLSAAKDVRTQSHALSNEESNLQAILRELHELELAGDDDSTVDGGLGKDVLVQGIEECKNEIKRLISELERPSREKSRLKQASAKLTWPLRSKEVDKMASLVQRMETVMRLGIGVETLKMSAANRKGMQKMSRSQKDSLKDKIIKWLAPASASANYEAARAQRHSHTGEWFLTGSQYNDWKKTSHQFLWLHGIREFHYAHLLMSQHWLIPHAAGCGKTILM
jgi:hypothetical protein